MMFEGSLVYSGVNGLPVICCFFVLLEETKYQLYIVENAHYYYK